MIYDCLSSTFYILRPFLTNYPEIKRHKETFSNYMESYPTIKHLAPLCIAFIHHMRQRTLIMRYEAFWPCPSRLFFKCILTMYVRQFCLIYFETNLGSIWKMKCNIIQAIILVIKLQNKKEKYSVQAAKNQQTMHFSEITREGCVNDVS